MEAKNEGTGNVGRSEGEEESSELGESMCSICLELMIEPVETNCKHRFCKFCFIRSLLVTPLKTCAYCRKKLICVNELTEFGSHIENQLVAGLLDDKEKNERREEQARRMQDAKILELGARPLDNLLVPSVNALDPSAPVYHSIRDENGVVVDSMWTLNGEPFEMMILPAFVNNPQRRNFIGFRGARW